MAFVAGGEPGRKAKGYRRYGQAHVLDRCPSLLQRGLPLAECQGGWLASVRPAQGGARAPELTSEEALAA